MCCHVQRGQGGQGKGPLVLHPAFKDRPPPSVTCHLCARDFGTTSLAIHIKTCERKWERKQRELPPVCCNLGGLGSMGYFCCALPPPLPIHAQRHPTGIVSIRGWARGVRQGSCLLQHLPPVGPHHTPPHTRRHSAPHHIHVWKCGL